MRHKRQLQQLIPLKVTRGNVKLGKDPKVLQQLLASGVLFPKGGNRLLLLMILQGRVQFAVNPTQLQHIFCSGMGSPTAGKRDMMPWMMMNKGNANMGINPAQVQQLCSGVRLPANRLIPFMMMKGNEVLGVNPAQQQQYFGSGGQLLSTGNRMFPLMMMQGDAEFGVEPAQIRRLFGNGGSVPTTEEPNSSSGESDERTTKIRATSTMAGR